MNNSESEALLGQLRNISNACTRVTEWFAVNNLCSKYFLCENKNKNNKNNNKQNKTSGPEVSREFTQKLLIFALLFSGCSEAKIPEQDSLLF